MSAADFLDLANVTVMRGEREVLHDVSLHIHAGEQVALLGPNGCGKSTLIKIITRELYPLARPETRTAVFGRERWDVTELKQRLGVVQAELPGKPMLASTGLDVILTGFFSSSTLWPNLLVTPEMRDRAETMLVRLHAHSLRTRLFGELSAGQQRRLLIGRALVASAGCLLLDEPSNALDLHAQRDLSDLLMQLAEEGTTMLHITHHIADLIPQIRRVAMMQDGRIAGDGPREEMLTERHLSALFGISVQLMERSGFLHAW